jgi:hypothetical protein
MLAGLLAMSGWGVLSVDVQEADATGLATIAFGHNIDDLDDGIGCDDLFTVRKVMITGGKDEGDTVRFTNDEEADTTCDGIDMRNWLYQFSGDAVMMPASGEDWKTFHGPMGYLNGTNIASPGERATSITEIAACYIKNCIASTCEDYSGSVLRRYVGDQYSNDGYICVGSANFL